MEGPGPGSVLGSGSGSGTGAAGRLLTEDEMAEVKKDVSGGLCREAVVRGAGGVERRGGARPGEAEALSELGEAAAEVGGPPETVGLGRAPAAPPGVPRRLPVGAGGSRAARRAWARPRGVLPGARRRRHPAGLASGGPSRCKADNDSQKLSPGAGPSPESSVFFCFLVSVPLLCRVLRPESEGCGGRGLHQYHRECWEAD